MAVNRHFVPHRPAAVFAVLRDGKSYARWVVGTSEIRDVDPGWPSPGSCLHWQAGRGPLRKEDVTCSLRVVEDVELEAEVVGRPLGTARVTITLDPVRDGCLITMDEHPLHGPLRTLHNRGLDMLIWLRNVETLRRLEREVERRR
ncbi:MAG: hypothetical protein QOJ62_437 [Actinomycetota bacterium]|nr:hypothetical protein [Actinomycetota bacterium]